MLLSVSRRLDVGPALVYRPFSFHTCGAVFGLLTVTQDLLKSGYGLFYNRVFAVAPTLLACFGTQARLIFRSPPVVVGGGGRNDTL